MGDDEAGEYCWLDFIMTVGFVLIWPLLYLCAGQ